MYDFAHPLSDAVEGITHSICTLEFEDHRPLYDWFLDQLPSLPHPRQIEFARLNLSYTVMSKRKLLELVKLGDVTGWDDPRLPTLVGMRRRGYPPTAIRTFCERIGVGKSDSWIDLSVLEDCVREELNETAPRVMAVLRPLKVVIENYPEDQVEEFDASNHPQKPEFGTRKVPFCRELYIERDDFMEDPPKKFYRLAPGTEVRLRYAYFVTCTDVVKDNRGNIIEIHCTYDPATRGGDSPDGRRVKGTIHWVSARHAKTAEVRLYDRLFNAENPGGENYLDQLNPESLKVLDRCFIEPALFDIAKTGQRFQFERLGYFCIDPDTVDDKLVINRTVTLRDTWAKIAGKQ